MRLSRCSLGSALEGSAFTRQIPTSAPHPREVDCALSIATLVGAFIRRLSFAELISLFEQKAKIAGAWATALVVRTAVRIFRTFEVASLHEQVPERSRAYGRRWIEACDEAFCGVERRPAVEPVRELLGWLGRTVRQIVFRALETLDEGL